MEGARYHRAALEMLGVPARRSPERARLIAEREALCGVTFPPAVVEWFALEDGDRLFHDYSNHDRLEALEQLGDPAETRQGYLRVGIENQGVVAFYVRVDEGDDPPTYDNNDEFGEERLDRIQWNFLSASFSNFIFDAVCIGRLHAVRHQTFFTVTGPVPGTAELQALGRVLRPGPVTLTDEVEGHRFFGPHELLTVRWPRDGEADWHLQADSQEALDGLRAAVGEIVALPAPPPRPKPRGTRRRWWRR